jgi:hypothetical protein
MCCFVTEIQSWIRSSTLGLIVNTEVNDLQNFSMSSIVAGDANASGGICIVLKTNLGL